MFSFVVFQSHRNNQESGIISMIFVAVATRGLICSFLWCGVISIPLIIDSFTPFTYYFPQFFQPENKEGKFMEFLPGGRYCVEHSFPKVLCDTEEEAMA